MCEVGTVCNVDGMEIESMLKFRKVLHHSFRQQDLQEETVQLILH